MKLNQLRKIIREEVRGAIKEELQEILNEAVQIASKPEVKKFNEYKPTNTTPPKVWSSSNISKPNTLEEMLQATKAEMTGADLKNIANAGEVQKPNFASMMSNQMVRESSAPAPGIDISQLDFVSKAKAVLDASNKKDKARLG